MPEPKDWEHSATAIGLAMAILLSGCAQKQHRSAGQAIHKGDRLTSFSQEIISPVHEFQVKAGGTYLLDLKVKNTGTQPWFDGVEPTSVDASYQWVDENGNVLPIESKRARLNRPVLRPGESDEMKLHVVAPRNPGLYTVWVSMVQEGVDWFFSRGTKPLVLHATVVAAENVKRPSLSAMRGGF